MLDGMSLASSDVVQGIEVGPVPPVAPAPLAARRAAAGGGRVALSAIRIDRGRDGLLHPAGRALMDESYLLPGESYQDRFAAIAAAYADDADHAQRLYDYVSRLWFMPATPVLSNGGTTRGLPISCLTGDMMVNTPDGAKPIRDIRVGDLVLTHRGRFRRVLATASRMADDVHELVVAKRGTRVHITPNHPALAERGWTPVGELSKSKDRVAINRALDVPRAPKFFDLSPFFPAEEFAEREDGMLAVAGASAATTRFRPNPARARVEVTADLAWAIGLFLAEGNIARNNKGFPHGLRVTVDVRERALAERFVEVVGRHFGVNGAVSAAEVERDGKTHRWITADVNGRALGSLFEAEFGTHGTNFRVPSWVLGLPDLHLECLLDAFADGDRRLHGNGRVGHTTIVLSNPGLAAGLYNVTLRLGLDASLRLDKPPVRGSTVPALAELRVFNGGFHPRHAPRPSADGAVSFSGISSLTPVPGRHEVFDIQVEEDRSFSVAGVVVHNCFLNEADDSLESIVDLWNENIWLAAKGGGIGSYWGNLRSLGEKVGQNGKTSGIVPFIRVQDSLTLAISQGSLRRGSAAVYLPVDHPEIEEFVEIRRPTGGDPNRKALNLHNAVVIPDAFMRAVEADGEWALRSPKDRSVVRTVSARALWIRILTARIETGEPYILYIDTVNRAIPEHHRKSGLLVKMSNLCSEITLPTGRDHHGRRRTAVCCLSSLNLDLWDGWKDHPTFVEDVLRFLDNVLDDFIARAPSERRNAEERFVAPLLAKLRESMPPGPALDRVEAELRAAAADHFHGLMDSAIYSASRERSVGLGVMGFHSLMQRKGVPLESGVARAWNLRVFRKIKADADRASRALALEKGPCPDAAEHGAMERFSNKTAIAPTASISVICGAVSPGIEPVAANVFVEKRLVGSFVMRSPYLAEVLARHGRDDEDTWASITVRKGSVQHLDFLTDRERAVFRTAFELDQRALVRLAADRAPMIDQAQSLNIFLPGDVHKRDLHEVHDLAWRLGVKSLYYCRSLSVQRAEAVNSLGVPALAGASTFGRAAVPRDAAVYPSPLPVPAVEDSPPDECLACQ